MLTASILSFPAGSPGAQAAENIAGALAASYRGNPVLQAERARQRATDEQVPQALSGWRPTVVTDADGGAEWSKTKPGGSSDTNPAGVTISLSQPIFNGFRTVSDTKRAEATVAAGRQNLLQIEQQVLLDAATAFMNVLRDREIVRLRERNVAVLREQLRASRVRFDVGEITKTDVEQSRARLSLSEADLAVARSNSQASAAFFVRVIGHAPGNLTYPRLSPRAPKSVQSAIAMAERVNPQILAAAFNAEAARHNIDLVESQLYPQVSLEANYSLNREPSSSIRRAEQGAIFGQISIPLYQGGLISSQVREAKQTASQLRITILASSRDVREAVVSSWYILNAAGQTITSFRAQVSANQLALEGVRQEAQVGTRTTLDVLDAEQELVNSQVSLVSAQRDQIVAGYQLIASVGRMTARDLGLSVEYYDSEENYRNVRNKLWGIKADTLD
ncbi:MAG: TolC family outer membrane protein [Parvibaculaceae bacterium]